MTPRPLVFISAVSRELKSARQLVANTLTFLGYQPVWQEIFGTESGDLREILRQQIDNCKGVVQLVGQCYGAEPPTPDEEFGRASYTQYEALYARKRGKKVWYLFIDEHFPADTCDNEPKELRELQTTYRKGLQSDSHVFHPLTSSEGLEASVLKLRDDLTRLRRGVKQWATGVAVLLIFIAGLVMWLVHSQRQAAREMSETKETVAAMTTEMAKLRQGIMEYPQVEARIKGSLSNERAPAGQEQISAQPGKPLGVGANAPGEKESPAGMQERVYVELGKQLGLDPKVLREKMPQVAEQLRRAPNSTSLERANAAYVARDYGEAERLALQAADEARKAVPSNPKDVLQAFKLAGLSAQKHIQYASAMDHFHDAEKLTDRDHNPKDWAEVQHAIADLLIDQGHYSKAENVLQGVVEIRSRTLGSEHPDTLRSRNRRAYTLKPARAEAEYREVIKLEETVLGPEHPDTLSSRHGLAVALLDQGKNTEAETEFRQVLKLREQVLGPEHPDTLRSRADLATAISEQGKSAEAEAQYREIIKIQEKVMGSEHPDTLWVRDKLADALEKQGKYAEAETEYRDVIKLRKKILGSEHPETLLSQISLSLALLKDVRPGFVAVAMVAGTFVLVGLIWFLLHPKKSSRAFVTTFKKIRLLALFVGNAALIGGMVIYSIVAIVIVVVVAKSNPQDPEAMLRLAVSFSNDWRFLLLTYFVATGLTLLGAYLVAKLSKPFCLFNTFLFGLISLLVGLLFISTSAGYPGWFTVLSFVTTLPVSLVPGYLLSPRRIQIG